MTSISPRDLAHSREDVIQALGIHFANNDISVEMLEQRLTLAFQSETRDQLFDLLADLPALPGYARPGTALPAAPLVTHEQVPERGVIGAFMGGADRSGSWLVPRQLKVMAVLGGVNLDLRQARFAPGVTEIDVFTIMGGVDILIPHGVRVEVLGMAVMGGFDASGGDVGSTDPNQPIIRLSGLAIMGGVDARHKKPNIRALAKFEKRLDEVRLRIRQG